MISVPKETSESSKAIVDVQGASHPGKIIYSSYWLQEKFYVFVAPGMIETVKDQFHKVPQWDII